MTTASRRAVLVLGAVAAVSFAAWALWPPAKAPAANNGPQALDSVREEPSLPPEPQTAAASAPTAPATPPHTRQAPDTWPTTMTSADEAAAAMSAGIELLRSGKATQARALLSACLHSGKLAPDDETAVVEVLTRLAEEITFSRTVHDDDPYAMSYRVKGGDVLVRVERELKLRVPTQLIVKINGLADAGRIQPGQQLKMILGPMHAEVSKSRFLMDIYLQRDDLPRMFVKRLSVGLGKDDSTPVGLWRVGLGKKMVRAPWNPPPTAAQRTKVLWGQAGYPLGKEGYWIGLEGLDDKTRSADGYGIHGTDDPGSIGKAASLGCVRLGDEDIATVFTLLYEYWSTVNVRP